MLDKERAYFSSHAEQWTKEHPGRFVVVKEEALLGIFSSMEEALAAGARLVGLEPFLVRELGTTPQEITIPALSLGLLRVDP